MEVTKLLQEFMMIPAPAGYEQEMVKKLKTYFEQYCDTVEVDLMGNCIGVIKGKKEKDMPKLMAFGHMDSLGMIVRKVEENGLVRVDRLGGLPEKVLPGTEFVIRNEEGNGFRQLWVLSPTILHRLKRNIMWTKLPHWLLI